jgi:hypothetical protein
VVRERVAAIERVEHTTDEPMAVREISALPPTRLKTTKGRLYMSTIAMQGLKNLHPFHRDYIQRRLEADMVDLQDCNDREKYGSQTYLIEPHERQRMRRSFRQQRDAVSNLAQPDPPGQLEDNQGMSIDDPGLSEPGVPIAPVIQDDAQEHSQRNTDPPVMDTDATMTADGNTPTDAEEERFNPTNFEDEDGFPLPDADDESDATEQQANVDLDGEHHDDDEQSSGSEDSDEEDWEAICPDPQRPYFHRYDVVVNIPKNTNPNATVAAVIGEAMHEIATADSELVFYPYRASYYLQPIGKAADLVALGSDVGKYVDKGKFDRFSARAVKNCRLSIALGSSLEPKELCDAARDPLFARNIQLYPKLLNFPCVVRAGFLLYSHKLHHSEDFERELQASISCPVALKWRRAAATIDLHKADSAAVGGKAAFLPSAICMECKESDLALVRAQLQNLYPLIQKADRFEYPRQTKATFCNTYNWYELEQVDEHSKDVAKALWHVQLLTNQRERYASIALLLKKPANYEYRVILGEDNFPSVRRLLLEMDVPYKDARGEYPSVFTSCDHNITPGTSDQDVGVTFRPQHAPYAQNVINNLAMHLQNRSGCSIAYLKKVLRSSHRTMMQSKQWHVKHQKAFDPKHTQDGLSSKELSHALAEFNLDISVVLQDAAMAVSRVAEASVTDGVSAPKAASNASQQLSMMNSVTTFRDHDADMADARTKDQIVPSTDPKQTAKNAWAAVRRISNTTPSDVTTTTPAATIVTLASGESTMKTTTIQEDSSLTTTTEQRGLSEAEVKAMLDQRDQTWQTRMAEEIARRLTEQREAFTKQQSDKQSRRKSKVQTAQENGGGPST